ncbi:MAG: UDP-glucose/GDP-mannose dehydrogenase family protein [Actinomycetota bacterium]
MKVAVVGTGHVGLTTAACLAHIGHDVLGIDENTEKVRAIEAGEVPFVEPGLADLVREGVGNGRLRMSPDPRDAGASEVVFVCVGTPTRASGEADLSQIERVATTLASSLVGHTLITEKSTVPVGTAEWIRQTIETHSPGSDAGFEVASNPEFLQEGRAVQDTLEPTRIVVGAPSEHAAGILRDVFRPIIDGTGCPFIVTDVATAELVKHSSNAFLATKISFINQVAEICERTGADVETVATAMGMDPRIGPGFLKAGIGYGGECLPKDVQAFRYRAEQLGVEFSLLAAVDRINQERRSSFVERIRSTVGDLEGKRVAVWGLSFKPETDDLRQSPSLDVIRRLLSHGARVVSYDPAAMPEAQDLLPEAEYADDPYGAATGADVLAVCTEWSVFATADLARLREAMGRPVVVDGRNVFDPKEMAKAGFLYVSMGRPTASGWTPE